ncbi:MAG TPA: RNA methyltransferase [Pirellulales bacterium]|jgi:tRNA G18 (ribose-2'-O)-methylase SpoU|nr:RNA methyltransferase [Pirellulales bacterium]
MNSGLIEIHSLDDRRLDPFRNLKQSNLTRWSGLFIAEGEKLTRRLLASDFETASVLLGRSYVETLAPLAKPDTPIFVVPDDDVEKIVGFNFHRGVLACGRRRPGRALDKVAQSQGKATIVVCPDVQDAENMGGMLRIGAALGVTAIMLGRRCADPFSRRVLRVSMGAALRLPLVESDDLPADLRRLHGDFNYELVATVLDEDAQPLAQIERPQRVAVLFGSEGHGLERSLVELCQRKVTIPMQPGTDSLNVAVAAGIVLHHYLRVAASG